MCRMAGSDRAFAFKCAAGEGYSRAVTVGEGPTSHTERTRLLPVGNLT